MVQMPYADSKLAKLINKRLSDLSDRKSQREITVEAGYAKITSILSMLKRGEAKVGLDRVPGLAKALEVDEVEFFHLALLQHFTDKHMVDLINRIFKKVPTDNEREFVEILREAAPGKDPIVTEGMKAAVKEALVPFLSGK